jgi:hypothetical protein
MMQGAYRIYRDQRTGQERVITPMGRFFYGQPSAGGHVNTQPETMPLQEFQQKVSRAVARPIVIPSGTALPLMIRSVSFDGVGRIELEAETTQDVYPNAQTVIPAGSLVDGWGSKSAGQWTLHWTAVSIRGKLYEMEKIIAACRAFAGSKALAGAGRLPDFCIDDGSSSCLHARAG